MHLKVRPEVSTLDFANAVVLNGFRIPALSTRRTETEIELHNGQTFAIAGLMNNSVNSTLQKIPGIGDIPILGLLFQSKAAQKDQTELVVMITPEILPNNSTGVTSTLPRPIEPYMPPAPPKKGLEQPAPPFRNQGASVTAPIVPVATASPGAPAPTSAPAARDAAAAVTALNPNTRTVVNGDAPKPAAETTPAVGRPMTDAEKKLVAKAQKQEREQQEADAKVKAAEGRPAPPRRRQTQAARQGEEDRRRARGREEAGRGRQGAPGESREGAGEARRPKRRRNRPSSRRNSRHPRRKRSSVAMAQIVSFFVTEDEEFKKHLGRLLRSGAIPVSVLDQLREGVAPDVVIVDARGDASSAMGTIERLRAGLPGSAIFAVARVAEPDLILQAMRAGANEFFTWPPAEDTFHSAMRRTASRRETAAGAQPAATTLVFFGAKGGAGTTTIAVNCGVELARITQAVDRRRRPQAGAGRGRAVSRRPAALQHHRRDRQPAPAGSRVPARAGGEAQVGPRDSRRIRSLRPAGRTGFGRRSRSCCGCWAGSTNTS